MVSAPGALLRFHAASGLRLALRGPIPVAAALTAGLGLQSDPGAAIAQAARALAGTGGSRAAGIVAAGAALVISSWAAPRLTPALFGWIRHLPAEGRSHRRALIAALVVAQAPVIVALAGLVLVARMQGDFDAARAAGLSLVVVAAAHLAAPIGPSITRVAAGLVACAGGVSGRWAWLAAGVAALIVFDRLAVDPGSRAACPRYGSATTTAAPARLAWRALGMDAVPAFLVAGLPTAAGAIMVNNNALGPAGIGRVVRLTALMAVALSTGVLAATLARALPVWGWLRSLPHSSARRVAADAGLLALPALAACAAAMPIDPLAALTASLCVPWMTLRAAGWMRPSRSGDTAVDWLPALEGAVLAFLVCLLPWVSAAALAASPAALAWAARRESARRVSA